MSYSRNRADLVGHLGQDPEVRRSQDGRPIVTLSVATSEQWRDKATGERKERTEWHRVVVFNEGLAKVAEQYLKKGSYIAVTGTIRTRTYDDQTGTKRYVTEIIVQGFGDTLGLLDKMPSNRPPPAEGPEAYGRTTSRDPAPQTGGGDIDDEIPF
jgi:single-strand DNA-binding protein